MRMVSEIVDWGTSALATGMPSVRTPWKRKAPMMTWLIFARYTLAPPMRMAEAAMKPICLGAV